MATDDLGRAVRGSENNHSVAAWGVIIFLVIALYCAIARYQGWPPFREAVQAPPPAVAGAGSADADQALTEIRQQVATAVRAATEAKAAAADARASASAAQKPKQATPATVQVGKPKGKPASDTRGRQKVANTKPSAAPTNSWTLPPPQEVKRVGPEPTPQQVAQATVPDGPQYVLMRAETPPAPWHVGSQPCRSRCTVKELLSHLKWSESAKAAAIQKVMNSPPDSQILIRNGDVFEAMAYGANKVQLNVVATWDPGHTERANVWRVIEGMVLHEVIFVDRCTNFATNRYHVRYILPAPPVKDYSYLGVIPRVLCP